MEEWEDNHTEDSEVQLPRVITPKQWGCADAAAWDPPFPVRSLSPTLSPNTVNSLVFPKFLMESLLWFVFGSLSGVRCLLLSTQPFLVLCPFFHYVTDFLSLTTFAFRPLWLSTTDPALSWVRLQEMSVPTPSSSIAVYSLS